MTRVLTPSSVGHYTVGSGSSGSSSYATVNGASRIPLQLVKYGDSSSGTYNDGGFLVGSPANNIANAMTSSNVSASRALASKIAQVSSYDSSDYGDYVRQALDIAANNTAQSQAFAREQMEYQKQSDANAMAWSANEAQKNRDYQERLSNTAHQREVQDLIAAGLNPILSANNGAYTGSGATGQAFSSSGAQGSVDTSASGILGSMASALLNTASQASIAKMYTDTSKYQADMQYAASKLQSETSLYNNMSNINANRAITQMNNQADIAKANINAGATVSAAATQAAATRYSADKYTSTNEYLGYMNAANDRYRTDKTFEGTKYTADTKNMITNPVGYVAGVGNILKDWLGSNERGSNNPAWNISINDYN